MSKYYITMQQKLNDTAETNPRSFHLKTQIVLCILMLLPCFYPGGKKTCQPVMLRGANLFYRAPTVSLLEAGCWLLAAAAELRDIFFPSKGCPSPSPPLLSLSQLNCAGSNWLAPASAASSLSLYLVALFPDLECSLCLQSCPCNESANQQTILEHSCFWDKHTGAMYFMAALVVLCS